MLLDLVAEVDVLHFPAARLEWSSFCVFFKHKKAGMEGGKAAQK